MNALLERPDNIFSEIRRYTASVAATIIFGFRATQADPFWAQVSIPNFRAPFQVTDVEKAVYSLVEEVKLPQSSTQATDTTTNY